MTGMTLNWNSKAPLAKQLSILIRRRYIDSSSEPVKLPTEHQLAVEFNISHTIARRAVELLRNAGMVVRRPRRGTFIAHGIKKELALAYYEEKQYSFSALLDIFEQQHPDIRITRFELPVAGYYEITSHMISEGKLDLLRISASLFHCYDPTKHFASLNDLGREYAGVTHTAPWSAFRFRKTRYGLPVTFGPLVIAFNSDMFRKAGVDLPHHKWTRDDFAEIAGKLTRHNGKGRLPEQYGFLCPSTLNRWIMFVYNHGGRLWDPAAGKFVLSQMPGFAGLDFLRNMVAEKICAPLHGGMVPYRLFLRGKAAMTLVSYHTLSLLRPEMKFNWGLAPFPVCRKRANLMVVDGMAMTRNTTHRYAAEKFLSFCLSDKAQSYIDGHGGSLPVRADWRRTDSDSPRSYRQVNENSLTHAVFPELPHNDRRIRMVEDETLLFVNGMQNADEYRENMAESLSKASF